jgi:hypothetical protein
VAQVIATKAEAPLPGWHLDRPGQPPVYVRDAGRVVELAAGAEVEWRNVPAGFVPPS